MTITFDHGDVNPDDFQGVLERWDRTNCDNIEEA